MGKLGYIVRCIAHMDYSALFDTVKQVHKLSGKPRAVILADIVSCGLSTAQDIRIICFVNFIISTANRGQHL